MHQYRYDKLAALHMQDSIWLTTVAVADMGGVLMFLFALVSQLHGFRVCIPTL
jgi:hypothetical protein